MLTVDPLTGSLRSPGRRAERDAHLARGRWLTQGRAIHHPVTGTLLGFAAPRPYHSRKPKRGSGGFTGHARNRTGGRGSLLRKVRAGQLAEGQVALG